MEWRFGPEMPEQGTLRDMEDLWMLPTVFSTRLNICAVHFPGNSIVKLN